MKMQNPIICTIKFSHPFGIFYPNLGGTWFLLGLLKRKGMIERARRWRCFSDLCSSNSHDTPCTCVSQAQQWFYPRHKFSWVGPTHVKSREPDGPNQIAWAATLVQSMTSSELTDINSDKKMNYVVGSPVKVVCSFENSLYGGRISFTHRIYPSHQIGKNNWIKKWHRNCDGE